MSYYFPNIDPVFVYKRKGDSTDPFLFLKETFKKVSKSKVILREIPDFKQDIIVKNSSGVILTETTGDVIQSGEYRVDYSVGIVFFNSNLEGQTITVEYYGTGYVSFPAERIWVENSGDELPTTIQDMINDSEIRYIEPYNVSTVYKKNDVVSFNGSSYMAKQMTTGNAPTELSTDPYWGVLARKGTDGTGTVHVHRDSFVATEGQSVFNLSHSYDQFQNRTDVIVGGVPQKTPDNYEETTPNSITLGEGVPAGTIVEVKYFSESIPLQSDIQTVVSNHTTSLNDHSAELSSQSNKIGNLSGLMTTSKTSLVDAVNENTSQLAEKATNLPALFLKMLQNGAVTKIKLIGDSITEGVGVTGHVSPPPNTQPKIFDNGSGTVFYEALYNENSWANFFRNYISQNYPTISFVNAGISGKSAKWGNANKQYWVGSENVVFVMLGTNDRWDGTNLSGYKSDLQSFLSYVKSKSNFMVVMTAPPTLNDYTDATESTLNPEYHFGMKEVDRIITEVCTESGYYHISMYRKFLEYASTGKNPLENILETNGGSHPNTSGHLVFWKLLQQEIGVIDSTIKNGKSEFSTVAGIAFDYATPATDSRFVQNIRSKYKWQIGESDPNIANYPEKSAGALTLSYGDNMAYVWEEYQLRGSGKVYKRYWNVNAWTTWVPLFSTVYTTFDYSTPATESRFTNFRSVYSYSIGQSDANISQYPEASAGVLRMLRGDHIAEVWEEYTLRNSGRTYKRYWNTGNSTWSEWIPMFGVVPIITQRLTTDPISIYTKGVEHTEIGLSNTTINSYPEAKAGVLITYRGASDIYSFQEYHIRQSNSVYKRYWDTTSNSWSSFQKISVV